MHEQRRRGPQSRPSLATTIAIVGSLLLAGCGDDDPVPDDPAPVDPAPAGAPRSTTTTTLADTGFDDTLVESPVDDAAAEASADDVVSLAASDPDGSLGLPVHTTEQLVALTPEPSALAGSWTATADGGVWDVPYPEAGCDDASGWPHVQGSRRYTEADGRTVLVVLMDVRPGEGVDAFAHYEQQYGCAVLAGAARTPVELADRGDGTVAVLQAPLPDVPESVLVLTRYGDFLELIAASDPAGDHLALVEQVRPIAEAALAPRLSG